jgi:hypothetical protein
MGKERDMRRIITCAVLAVATSSAAVGPALATTPPDTAPGSEAPASSDATAGSEAPADTGGTDATAGEAVVVVDDTGSPVAAISVTSVEQAWTGYGDYPVPDVGFEYLRVTVLVESRTPRGVYPVEYYHFLLQDVDGFLTTVQNIPTAEQVAAGETLTPSAQLSMGQTFELPLTFEIVAGVAPQALFYQPAGNRLITVHQFG